MTIAARLPMRHRTRFIFANPPAHAFKSRGMALGRIGVLHRHAAGRSLVGRGALAVRDAVRCDSWLWHVHGRAWRSVGGLCVLPRMPPKVRTAHVPVISA